MIILGIAVVFFIVIMVVFAKEVKNAPTVDEKEPFLWDDYNPMKEANVDEDVFRYTKTFCKHCKFYDGTAMCLHENNFGELTKHVVINCKDKSMFEVK